MTDSMMPDNARVRELLMSIGWQDVQIEPVHGGTVNATFRLTDDKSTWYLRIGPTIAEVESGPSWFTGKGLRREQQAIALWHNHRHLFPETAHSDFTHRHIDADWVIQKAVRGDSWEAMRSRLSIDQSASLWTQFGRLTAELHRYTSEEFGPPESGYGHRRWSELCRWDATGLMNDAHRYELPLQPFRQLCELVDRSTHILDEIKTPRLIHSDLGLRHVMVELQDDEEPVITGLIDMEFARFADPASESIFVTQALMPQPDRQFDLFLNAYGAERPDRFGRTRSLVYQLVAMAWWITDAARRQRPTEARNILDAMMKRIDEDRHIW